MRTLRVLLTNNALAHHAGSETYLRDVAVSLLRRGHRPVAFSLVQGTVADELRAATVPVVDDLLSLGQPPDVIHGHHHLETLIAALTFPDVPIVHFCHGWIPWVEKPLRHPSIRRYVAVDEVCVDRLIHEAGVAPDTVELMLNFVSLARFQPRACLPERPRRALVFSNMATPDGYVRHIAAACRDAGIELDIAGVRSGNALLAPEQVLPQYDLVFAKARAALEAMAVGCAVVMSDAMGCGPLVTPDNFDRLRVRNFGVRELQRPHEIDWYAQQIAAYDREAAAAVRDRVRAEADLEPAIDRLLSIYERAMSSPSGSGDALLAAARHLHEVVRPLKDAWSLGPRLLVNEEDTRLARVERAELEKRVTALQSCIEAYQVREESRHAERAAAQAREEALAAQCAAVQAREEALLADHAAALAREESLEAQHAAALAREASLMAQHTAIVAREASLRTHHAAVIAAREEAIAGLADATAREQAVIAARDEAIAGLAEAAAREQTGIETIRELERALADAQERCLALEKTVATYTNLSIIRLRDGILRLPLIGPGAHGAARRLARFLKA